MLMPVVPTWLCCWFSWCPYFHYSWNGRRRLPYLRWGSWIWICLWWSSYYADPEAEWKAFHICTADGAAGLAKYSFLCPNGTLFNQNYFICDWWFNLDCSAAEDYYSLKNEITALPRMKALAEAAAADIQKNMAPYWREICCLIFCCRYTSCPSYLWSLWP